jgi:SAM-dependent methyltransferase
MAVSRDLSTVVQTARAFDAVAEEYHCANAGNPILQHMRERAIAALRRHVPAGADLLDLGCGPGTDHPTMLGVGYCVTAIDASPEMVRQARRRADALWGPDRPTLVCRAIDQVDRFPPESFDAAFSNFGPLNCVPDLLAVAGQIHDVLRPGGVLVASVIGRICPWEIGLYLSRGDLRRAVLRFRPGAVAVPLKDGTVWTRYLTPGAFERTFRRAGFRRRELRGLGVLAPPPYLEAFAARRPALVARLLAMDGEVGSWPLLRSLGDHFLIVLQRD